MYYDECGEYVVAVCDCGDDSGCLPDRLTAEQWALNHQAGHDEFAIKAAA